MLPVHPSTSKLPPAVINPLSGVSGVSDPQQPHWPPSDVIDGEVAEGFALREAQEVSSHDLEKLSSPSSPMPPKQSVLTSLTEVEGNLVVEEETFTVTFQDSLAAFLPPAPQFFIGRKEQLDNLHKALRAKGIVVIIPEEEISCKIGKSTLTSQYSKTHSAVLWITARNKKALDASFDKLANLFNLEPSKVREYLSGQERLIIFDGAQDPELLKGYLPQGKCQVVITSRRREWPFPKIEIGPFSFQEAIDFLCQVTQKEDRVAAQRIAEELDYLPTSLEKAAKAVVENQAELAGYTGIKEGILDTNNQLLKQRSNLGDRNRNFTGRETGLVAL